MPRDRPERRRPAAVPPHARTGRGTGQHLPNPTRPDGQRLYYTAPGAAEGGGGRGRGRGGRKGPGRASTWKREVTAQHLISCHIKQTGPKTGSGQAHTQPNAVPELPCPPPPSSLRQGAPGTARHLPAPSPLPPLFLGHGPARSRAAQRSACPRGRTRARPHPYGDEKLVGKRNKAQSGVERFPRRLEPFDERCARHSGVRSFLSKPCRAPPHGSCSLPECPERGSAEGVQSRPPVAAVGADPAALHPVAAPGPVPREPHTERRALGRAGHCAGVTLVLQCCASYNSQVLSQLLNAPSRTDSPITRTMCWHGTKRFCSDYLFSPRPVNLKRRSTTRERALGNTLPIPLFHCGVSSVPGKNVFPSPRLHLWAQHRPSTSDNSWPRRHRHGRGWEPQRCGSVRCSAAGRRCCSAGRTGAFTLRLHPRIMV